MFIIAATVLVQARAALIVPMVFKIITTIPVISYSIVTLFQAVTFVSE